MRKMQISFVLTLVTFFPWKSFYALREKSTSVEMKKKKKIIKLSLNLLWVWRVDLNDFVHFLGLQVRVFWVFFFRSDGVCWVQIC